MSAGSLATGVFGPWTINTDCRDGVFDDLDVCHSPSMAGVHPEREERIVGIDSLIRIVQK